MTEQEFIEESGQCAEDIRAKDPSQSRFSALTIAQQLVRAHGKKAWAMIDDAQTPFFWWPNH